MMNVTLRQLRYFEAVAATGHFGRAADLCAISQPAISVQIKELEETLGMTLFERNARQISLTPFGEVFASRCRDILRSVDDLGALAQASHGALMGRLRLGIIPTIAPYLLPRIIENLGQSNTDLDLHVRETQTDHLIVELVEGRLDTAIVALPISEPSLTELPLFEENFVLVRSVADGDKPVPDGETLREMRLLLLEEGHCFRDQALAFCGMRPSLPKESMEGSSLSTLVQMVAAGIGVTLIPEMAVGVETRSANVSIAQFDNPKPSRRIGMVWRKTNPLTQQLKQIADVVTEAAQSLR